MPKRRLISRREIIAAGSAIAGAWLLKGCAHRQGDFSSGSVGKTPRSPFNRTSTAEGVTAEIDLTGRTGLITGCNSGIGLETLRVLVLRGAHVYALARNREKAAQACAAVMGPSIKGKATPLACEHTNYDSVVDCANAVQEFGAPLDMLICNAGVLLSERELVRGVEKTFAINHLSHFILVNRLLSLVNAAAQGRIVIVGSLGYRFAPPAGIEFDNLAAEGEFSGLTMYGQSKLANGLFARELAYRTAGTSVTANVLHPGTVATNIYRHVDRGERLSLYKRASGWLYRMRERIVDPKHARQIAFQKSLAQGAATTCYVATYPAIAKVSGAYFVDCKVQIPGGRMRDDEMASKLWAVSTELTQPWLKSA